MAFPTWRSLLWRCLGRAVLGALMAFGPLLARAEEVGRHAVLVIDANTGRVLYQRSADEARFPASLVKLMTLYLLFEQIEQGRLALTSKIRFSANAVAAAPSRLGVEEGAEISVIDAIKALITKSANDVAIAVAEHIGGTEERFAQLMNRKARELGMTKTVFRNASGLPDPDQMTTARDMIALALRLHDQFPRHYPLFATRTFTWGDDTYRNHNGLLFTYRGMDGMKTGYTRASGFNLVASARRGKKHVVVAYFGGATAALRNAAVRVHLDAGLAKASDRRTRMQAAPIVARAKAQPDAVPPKASPVVAAAVVPAPQPAQRSVSIPGVEVVRVRPVPVAGAAPAPNAPEEPEDVGAKPLAAAPAPARTEKTAPAPEPAGTPAGPFQVQVGAFNTQGEAERQLSSVRQRAGSVLGEHAAHMSQVKRGDKVFFRARYVGFDAHAAAAGVCTELKRLDIDCLVMKGE